MTDPILTYTATAIIAAALGVLLGSRATGKKEEATGKTCAAHDIAFSSLSEGLAEVKAQIQKNFDEVFSRLRDVEVKVEVLKERKAS